MMRVLGLVIMVGLVVKSAAAQEEMPAAIRGEWRIVKILRSSTAACWDETRAKELLGSRLRYEAGQMVWKGGAIAVTDALPRTLTAKEFREQYGVGLEEVGIRMRSVTEFDLQHEDADVTGGSTEVPGDTVVVAGAGRVVVSACGVYYSAVRVTRGRP